MARIVAGKNIAKVAVIDDDDAARSVVADTVATTNVETVPIAGPLGSVADALKTVNAQADALVSDHHLTKANYAGFFGAEAVATAYRSQLPAVLCTGWAQPSILEIREWRRWIPMVVNTDDAAANPEIFITGIELCVEEFKGNFSPPRKSYPVLVRVEEERLSAATPTIYVVVTSFSANKVIELLARKLPPLVLDGVRSGTERFHARMNKGAEAESDVYFEDWSA